MTLGELKSSLNKLPPDMNDMEVIVSYAINGEPEYELLCFTGYFPLKGHECIILGTMTEIQRKVENGEVDPPEGYKSPKDMKREGEE